MQQASDRALLASAQRGEYERHQADRDLQWEHNQLFELATRLQDITVAGMDDSQVRPWLQEILRVSDYVPD
jgi:hypothetical protein